MQRLVVFIKNREFQMMINSMTKLAVFIVGCFFFVIAGSAEIVEQSDDLSISADQRTIVLRTGKIFLTISDLPTMSNIAPGITLENQRFSKITPSPDGKLTAIVVDGANHQWVGILNMVNINVTEVHILYGGSVNKFVWSPDSQKLAIEAYEGSGLRAIIVWNVDNSVVRINSLLLNLMSGPMELIDSKWDSYSKILSFGVYERKDGERAIERYEFRTDTGVAVPSGNLDRQ